MNVCDCDWLFIVAISHCSLSLYFYLSFSLSRSIPLSLYRCKVSSWYRFQLAVLLLLLSTRTIQTWIKRSKQQFIFLVSPFSLDLIILALTLSFPFFPFSRLLSLPSPFSLMSGDFHHLPSSVSHDDDSDDQRRGDRQPSPFLLRKAEKGILRHISEHVINPGHDHAAGGSNNDNDNQERPILPESIYLSSSSPTVVCPEKRRSLSSCIAAIFMITIGTLLALTFVMIGIGKALATSKKHIPDIQTSSTTTHTVTAIDSKITSFIPPTSTFANPSAVTVTHTDILVHISSL